MKEKTEDIINWLYETVPILKSVSTEIESAFDILLESFINGNKLLICGNGGSASDSEHIVGELMKEFRLKRPVRDTLRKKIEKEYGNSQIADLLQESLPAISLSAHAAFLTAFSNDVSWDMAFAQQVLGYGKKGDVLLGITTSGNSINVINAMKIARLTGIKTISLTGAEGGQIRTISDISIVVPEKENYKIQELHLPIYHTLCAAIENEIFGGQ